VNKPKSGFRKLYLPILFILFIGGIGVQALTSCSSDDGNEGTPLPGGNSGNLESFIKGKFNKNATEQAFFQLNKKINTVAPKMLARTLSSKETELEGELEDGDIIIKLRGSYDEETGNYTASADASFMRYTISSTLSGATATVVVKDGPDPDNWPVQVFDVTEDNTVDITGTAQEAVTTGMPENILGNWYFTDDGVAGTIIFTEWALLLKLDAESLDSLIALPILEVENKSGYSDIIIGNPQYEATDEQATDAHRAWLAAKGVETEKFANPSYSPGFGDGEYCYKIVGSIVCQPNEDGTDCREPDPDQLSIPPREAQICPGGRMFMMGWFAPKEVYDKVQNAIREGKIEQYLKSIGAEPTIYYQKFKVGYTANATMSWVSYVQTTENGYTSMLGSFAAAKTASTLSEIVMTFNR